MKHTKWEQHWRFNQELVQALKAQEAIVVECRIAREQAELQAAWDALQDVPSYVERDLTTEHMRVQCAYCKEWYAISYRTRRLLLTYCTVECAVGAGMAQQDAEQHFEEVIFPEEV